jgi:CRISPR system Cascade subunit CasD
VLGWRDLPLADALKNEPWLASDWYQKRKRGKNIDKLSIVMDGTEKDGAIFATMDTPISFDQRRRQYGPRGIVRTSASVNTHEAKPTEHDPFAEMEGA